MPKVSTQRPDIAPEIQHLAVPMDSLALWPGNYRQGDIGMLTESLRRFGQPRPILVQKSTNRIVAGNQLYRAATAIGYTEIAAIVTDMSDRDAAAFVVTDNRAHELGTNDEDLLAKMLAELARDGNLGATGYDGDDVDDLLRGVVDGAGPSPDSGALSAEPWVKPGDIFLLDRHRIICGDASDPIVLDTLLAGASPALMVVTPAYETDPANKHPLTEDTIAYLTSRFSSLDEEFWFGADHYRSQLPYADRDGSWLVWDKRSETTDLQFGDGFELVWSKNAHKRDILRFAYTGVADSEARKRGDFTPRPTALFTEIFERWSRFETIVLAPFLDSGPTLTAAEKCGRVLYGARQSPAHVQSLLERWEAYSGAKPVLITE